MNEIVIPFTITATDVNLLDTADFTVISLQSNDRIVRVPIRLELYKAAGTAYTLAPIYQNRKEGYSPELVDFYSGGTFLAVRDSYGQVFFKVQLEGFLDRANAGSLVALPVGGITLRPGSSEFTVHTTVPVSGGT